MMCTYFRVHVTYIPPPHPTNLLTAADTITAHTAGPPFLAAEGGCCLHPLVFTLLLNVL